MAENLRIAASLMGVSLPELLAHRERGENRCSSCKLWLPFARFYPDRRRKIGLHPYCIECVSSLGRAQRKAAQLQAVKRPVTQKRAVRSFKLADAETAIKQGRATCKHSGATCRPAFCGCQCRACLDAFMRIGPE